MNRYKVIFVRNLSEESEYEFEASFEDEAEEMAQEILDSGDGLKWEYVGDVVEEIQTIKLVGNEDEDEDEDE